MDAHRAPTLMAAAALALCAPTMASAQVEDGVVVNIMRECAKISDTTARLACYDNNIRQAGAATATASPSQAPTPQASAPAPAAAAPTGFGAETVRLPQATVAAAQTQSEIDATVTRATPREPGIYLLDMADGSQWQFSQSVDRNYRVPANGTTVRIERASLGSFLLRYDSQAPVRVRRLR